MPNPKKGKAALKRKNKNSNKRKSKNKPKSNSRPNNKHNGNNTVKSKQSESNTQSSPVTDIPSLLKKWDIHLGPRGYVPARAGSNASKSIHIDDVTVFNPSGGSELLSKTAIHITQGTRYGLVGKNGCGKSTLLKLMNNYEIVGFPNHIRMILVNQEELVSDCTVLESVLRSDEVLQRLIEEENRLIRIQTDVDDIDNNDNNENEEKLNEIELLLEYLNDVKQDYNLDFAEKRAIQILDGLGFSQDMIFNCQTKNLSGGWQMRCKLAQALFVEPDLMLLDEPTNHLDFPTVLWLEDYLNNRYNDDSNKHNQKSVIIVSHDRTFLNSVCQQTISFGDNKKLTYYQGGFDDMKTTSRIEEIEQQRAYDKKKAEINEIKQWLASSNKNDKKQAAIPGKRKALKRLEEELIELEPVKCGKPLRFEFPDNGGLDQDLICEMKNVSFRYGHDDNSPSIISNISLRLDIDSRIGIIGANGVGKSTLVKLITQQLTKEDGDIKGEILRNRHARISIFTQYHIDQLNMEQSATEYVLNKFKKDFEELKITSEDAQIQKARGRLGRFKLTNEQHTNKMKYLSGGQRSRVAFCIATWRNPHFLILDEPTNHLDMESIDALIDAIDSFKGGMIVISHDEYFLKRVISGAQEAEEEAKGKAKEKRKKKKNDKSKGKGKGKDDDWEAIRGEFWCMTREKICKFDEWDDAKAFALKSRINEYGNSSKQEDKKSRRKKKLNRKSESELDNDNDEFENDSKTNMVMGCQNKNENNQSKKPFVGGSKTSTDGQIPTNLNTEDENGNGNGNADGNEQKDELAKKQATIEEVKDCDRKVKAIRRELEETSQFVANSMDEFTALLKNVENMFLGKNASKSGGSSNTKKGKPSGDG